MACGFYTQHVMLVIFQWRCPFVERKNMNL